MSFVAAVEWFGDRKVVVGRATDSGVAVVSGGATRLLVLVGFREGGSDDALGVLVSNALVVSTGSAVGTRAALDEERDAAAAGRVLVVIVACAAGVGAGSCTLLEACDTEDGGS